MMKISFTSVVNETKLFISLHEEDHDKQRVTNYRRLTGVGRVQTRDRQVRMPRSYPHMRIVEFIFAQTGGCLNFDYADNVMLLCEGSS